MNLDWLPHTWRDAAAPFVPFGTSLGIAAVAVLLGVLASAAVMSMIRRWGRHSDSVLDTLLIQYLRTPLRLLAPTVALLISFPMMEIAPEWLAVLRQILSIAGIMAATWFAVGVLEVAQRYVVSRFDLQGTDGLVARSVQTRMRVGRNVGVVIIVLIGFAIALTTIEPVRQLGTSLLASAGVAGVVIGFAAQRSIATLLAGVQIAFTEPIRIDDVVVVEGEWGRIEEITLTYVVVRLWDQRRLVVPITWFLDKPFQNWTRTETELLGTVELFLDPTVALDEIRTELDRILEKQTGLWDGRLKVVQVTNMSEQTVTVRLLLSAADAGRLWDLRCNVREAMLAYLQARPGALSKVRVAAVPGGEPPLFPG